MTRIVNRYRWVLAVNNGTYVGLDDEDADVFDAMIFETEEAAENWRRSSTRPSKFKVVEVCFAAHRMDR